MFQSNQPACPQTLSVCLSFCLSLCLSVSLSVCHHCGSQCSHPFYFFSMRVRPLFGKRRRVRGPQLPRQCSRNGLANGKVRAPLVNPSPSPSFLPSSSDTLCKSANANKMKKNVGRQWKDLSKVLQLPHRRASEGSQQR